MFSWECHCKWQTVKDRLCEQYGNGKIHEINQRLNKDSTLSKLKVMNLRVQKLKQMMEENAPSSVQIF